MEPIFLNTGFRSCGTWLWSTYRADPNVMAFFEPLHDLLGGLTAEEIPKWTSETTNLDHPHLDAPYFAEYSGLLNPDGVGVAGFRSDFGMHSYFDDTDGGNMGLAPYLQGLINHAEAQGKTPVFKFTRMLARAGWLRRWFPEAKQVLLLRSPLLQFWSSFKLAREGNSLLLMAPIFALSRAPHLHSFDIPYAPLSHGIMEVIGFYSDFVNHTELAKLFQMYLLFCEISTARSIPQADEIANAPAEYQSIEELKGDPVGEMLISLAEASRSSASGSSEASAAGRSDPPRR